MIDTRYTLKGLLNDLQSWRKPISTDALLEKYKGTDKEDKMRIIFGNMDEMDSVNSVMQKDNYVSR